MSFVKFNGNNEVKNFVPQGNSHDGNPVPLFPSSGLGVTQFRVRVGRVVPDTGKYPTRGWEKKFWSETQGPRYSKGRVFRSTDEGPGKGPGHPHVHLDLPPVLRGVKVRLHPHQRRTCVSGPHLSLLTHLPSDPRSEV